MSKTIENLSKAFVGESQARNRYTFYAKIAKKEGFEQVADLFLLTADNEREHAKWLMRMINNLKKDDTPILIEAEVPTTLGDTIENLKAAIAGEHYETTSMYPEFANIAEEEGHASIAKRLRAIANAELHHENRFKKLLEQVENNSMFKKTNKVYWVCRKCGYLEEAEEAPDKCPSCDHPKEYFEMKCEEY
ncbi:MAG: rubrerythrin family protein [Patescibacteria group bacterium]|nr:rubrerythrin family protein [Patescibacteria group bacterium]